MKTVSAVFLLLALLLSSVAFGVVGGGDIVFKVKNGDVTFSHENHVKSSSIACKECHDKLYVTPAKHKKVTMAEMAQGKSCGACHNGKRAFTVKGNCQNCHQK